MLNLEILANEDLDFVKSKTKETTLSLFKEYNNNPQQNLSKEELAALTSFSKNRDIMIQKPGKGNCIVIADWGTCVKNLLSDLKRFKILL